MDKQQEQTAKRAQTGQITDAPSGMPEALDNGHSAATQAGLASMSVANSLRGVGRSLIVSGAVPFIIYNLLKSRGVPDIAALGGAAMAPAIDGIVTVARKRRIDLISALVLTGIAISIVAVLLGGDPRLLLIRESFLTAALGIACFVSFLLPRPLMFYFGRYFATGDDPVKVARYNELWQYSYFRHVNRVITVVWGMTYVGEFALRVLMVTRLSINQVLAISPIVFSALTIGVILWTFAYARYARQRGEALQARAMHDNP